MRKVREAAGREHLYADRQYNKNIFGPYFNEGDKAYVLIQCPTHKFGPRWTGPFTVAKRINDHLYVFDIAGMEKVVNISKMKPFSMNKYVDQTTPSTKESKESAPGFQSDDSQDDYVIVTSRLPNTNSTPESTDNERPELISEVWNPSMIPQRLLRPRSEREYDQPDTPSKYVVAGKYIQRFVSSFSYSLPESLHIHITVYTPHPFPVP